MLIAAAVVEGLVDHRRSGTSLGPLPHLAIRRLDDLAYGWGSGGAPYGAGPPHRCGRASPCAW
ncbi:hypothetical protein [Streptomyces sp. NPDC092370]|uniref:hypothetical protein n=1 Tax=Streptomyces sp. NPDC092370 TaxID=3366016 RepID=UPI00382A3DC4